MKNSGYSGTPLLKKLGIKSGFNLLLINTPDNYSELTGELPQNTQILKKAEEKEADFIHIFLKEFKNMEKEIMDLKPKLKENGILWVSWPKGSSKIPTDLNRDIIRETILQIGLVDVKVCAIDEHWSGLKFVYRLKDRK